MKYLNKVAIVGEPIDIAEKYTERVVSPSRKVAAHIVHQRKDQKVSTKHASLQQPYTLNAPKSSSPTTKLQPARPDSAALLASSANRQQATPLDINAKPKKASVRITAKNTIEQNG